MSTIEAISIVAGAVFLGLVALGGVTAVELVVMSRRRR